MGSKNYAPLIMYSWDIFKVSQLLAKKVPFEDLIFDRTDILLELLLRNEFILVERLLGRGFPIKESKFNYLTPILDSYTDEKSKYIDLLFKYLDPKEAINKKIVVTEGNSLSLVAKQKNQSIISRLSKLGGDWNAPNKLQQTSVHFLLRNQDSYSDELLEELKTKDLDLDKEDKFNISPRDIIKSFLLVEGWGKENQKLLEAIKYENRG